MGRGSTNLIVVVFGIVSPLLFLGLVFFALYYCKRSTYEKKRRDKFKTKGGDRWVIEEDDEEEEEDLVLFPGGEDLSVHGILDAPGEVVGKSSYSTMYKASLQLRRGSVNGNGTSPAVLMLLRFVRPTCMGRTKEIFPAVQVLGFVRHPNLVPLWALYVGPRGEKLLVHPFFLHGSLSQFIRDGDSKSYRWNVICRISLGIAKAIDHLHNALAWPLIHGNLKSKNILFDSDLQPRLSDYGLHLLLNPASAQEMLDISASQGYKAPELIKTKDASKETDIYSLGVIFLEMLTRKEPKTSNLSLSWELHLPASVRNLALERKLPDIFSPNLFSRGKDQESSTEEKLLSYFQLAMACCSPSPSLRPEIKQILRKLEEISR